MKRALENIAVDLTEHFRFSILKVPKLRLPWQTMDDILR